MFGFKKLLLLFLIILLAFVIILFFYFRNLSNHVESRFAEKRWQIPSRVYSDTTIIYPGQRLNLPSFFEKLHRHRYRQIDGLPKLKGEMKVSSDNVNIYLYDAGFQGVNRKGFPLRIRFQADMIESMTRFDTQEPLSIFEFEPEELMLFFGPERERRQLVSIKHIPDHLIKAVMAIEDNHYYDHYGISVTGIIRALYKNLRHSEIRQGGSTITQQLAKNYFLTPERTISRKAKELLIALILEVRYTKDEILEIYFNEIYLGQRGSESINGVGEASFFYFGKPVDELSLPESAMIAGLIKGPNRYSPYINPNTCLSRRNSVLRAMVKNGWLAEEKLQALIAAPVETAGFAAHPRRAPYFMDYLYQQLQVLYSEEDLSSLGLSIYTTLDTQIQKAAEIALEEGLRHLENIKPAVRQSLPEKRLQGAIVVIQPKTGYILAMAGGRNYSLSQFNRITQARRQTGSAFKPFVFLTALDKFTPASLFSNAPKAYLTEEGEWIPQNFKPTPDTLVSMRESLAKSHNRATVDLAMQTGLDEIIRQARSFHFSTPLNPYPSLALGAFEAIPLELARAYCVFAADGVQPYPLSLKNVQNSSGAILNRRHMQIERLISPAKAFIISSMLRTAVVEGTAGSLKNYGISFPVAGKTGTTSNFRDAWFIGYTPDILALVWVGFDNGDSIHATGSGAALPIWANLMRSIPQNLSGTWFQIPPGVVKKKICPESGLLPKTFACPETKEEVFLEENVPDNTCTVHNVQIFDKIMKGIKSFGK